MMPSVLGAIIASKSKEKKSVNNCFQLVARSCSTDPGFMLQENGV